MSVYIVYDQWYRRIVDIADLFKGSVLSEEEFRSFSDKLNVNNDVVIDLTLNACLPVPDGIRVFNSSWEFFKMPEEMFLQGRFASKKDYPYLCKKGVKYIQDGEIKNKRQLKKDLPWDIYIPHTSEIRATIIPDAYYLERKVLQYKGQAIDPDVFKIRKGPDFSYVPLFSRDGNVGHRESFTGMHLRNLANSRVQWFFCLKYFYNVKYNKRFIHYLKRLSFNDMDDRQWQIFYAYLKDVIKRQITPNPKPKPKKIRPYNFIVDEGFVNNLERPIPILIENRVPDPENIVERMNEIIFHIDEDEPDEIL